MLICHLSIFSGEVPVKALGTFFSRVVCFLSVELPVIFFLID